MAALPCASAAGGFDLELTPIGTYQSPNGRPLVVTGSEVNGTTTIFEIGVR